MLGSFSASEGVADKQRQSRARRPLGDLRVAGANLGCLQVDRERGARWLGSTSAQHADGARMDGVSRELRMRICQALIPNTRSSGARGIIWRGPSWTVGIVPFSMPSLIVR
jgi:hypothetical protein